MSIELDILAALEAGLAIIRTANGYQTDAGAEVFKNLEYQLRPDVDCIIYFPGRKRHTSEGEVPPSLGEENNFLPISIEAFVEDDLRGTQGQALKEDLEKWVKANRYLGGLAEYLQEFEAEVSVQEGETPFSFVQVSFTIFYVTAVGEI